MVSYSPEPRYCLQWSPSSHQFSRISCAIHQGMLSVSHCDPERLIFLRNKTNFLNGLTCCSHFLTKIPLYNLAYYTKLKKMNYLWSSESISSVNVVHLESSESNPAFISSSSCASTPSAPVMPFWSCLSSRIFV